jgi:hypothetical protein
LYAPARNAGELQQAFVRVFTRVCGLPIYDESSGAPQVHFDLGSEATRSLVFFFHADPTSKLLAPGKKLLESQHITVYEQHHPERDYRASISGSAAGTSTILAVEQPLRFDLLKPLPAATLTESELPVSAALIGGRERIWNKLFMRDGTVQLQLTSANGHGYVRALATDDAAQRFDGIAKPSHAEEYDAVIQLSSPYGEVATHVGKLRVSFAAASLPDQVEVEYLALPAFLRLHLPASTRFNVQAVLPTGTAQVRFQPVSPVDVSASEFTVDPSHPADVAVTVHDPARASSPTAIPYEVVWSDGQQAQSRAGVIIVVAHPLSIASYLAMRKAKLVAIICILLVATWIYRRSFVKHAMRGVLLVKAAGDPRLRRFEAHGKTVSVYESSSDETVSGEKLRIATGRDRLLFTMKLVHQAGQWQPAIEVGKDVSISGPLMPGNKESIAIKDSGLNIECHNFQKA